MLHNGIEFYNVAELVPEEDGFALSRLPASVRETLNPRARDWAAFFASGVELRFRLTQDEARLCLRSIGAERLPALIYYGDFQSGWQSSTLAIGPEPTWLTVRPSPNLRQLQSIAQERHLPFDPALVRVILPYTHCLFLAAEGSFEPPHPGDAPERTLLSYGSSITHGSLALGAPQTYAARIAHTLGCDLLNLGLAGTCHLEEAMALHLRERRDWHVATIEMGINMLDFSEEEFSARVHRFVEILSQETRPVFITSLFRFNGDGQEKAQRFRAIVREACAGRLPFVDGLDLLDDPAMISEDLIHPTFYGHEQIARRWGEIIQKALRA